MVPVDACEHITQALLHFLNPFLCLVVLCRSNFARTRMSLKLLLRQYATTEGALKQSASSSSDEVMTFQCFLIIEVTEGKDG